MRIAATLARVPPRVAFWAMAGVALFLSHDAVFLVQVGPGDGLSRALRDAGHDYWGAASLILALVGLAVGAGAILRLRLLRRRVALLRARRGAPTPIGRRASPPSGFGSLPSWLSASCSRRTSSTSSATATPSGWAHCSARSIRSRFRSSASSPPSPASWPPRVRRTEGALLAIISAALRRPRPGRPCAGPRSQLVLPRAPHRMANAIAGRAPPRAFASGY